MNSCYFVVCDNEGGLVVADWLWSVRYAEEVIGECADAWKKLVKGEAKRGDISL